MSDLQQRLAQLACVPVLLVATDYDGTLAPIVDDPAQAKPDREAMVAIRALAALGQTHVAIISGRSLADLAALTGAPDAVHLVGSHGSEFDPDFARSLTPGQAKLREQVEGALTQIASSAPGLRIETKPASVALHYRTADEATGKAALEAALRGPAALDGVFTRHGKMVVELGVVSTNKGDALRMIRRRVGATAAIFFGDDATDEDAFAILQGPDVAVKIGPGDSIASLRVDDTRDVARALAFLAERRAGWLQDVGAVSVEKHALLSDQRTCALVTPEARIVWMCLPRIDSSALFAELVGGPAAGYFAVRPEQANAPPHQRYDGNTLTLVTEWEESGLIVTDYLDCSDGRHFRRAGRTDLIRRIEGRGRAVIEFSPRMDFGRAHTALALRDGGIEIEDSIDPIVLRSPGVEWELLDQHGGHTARAVVDLDQGPLTLELRYGTGFLGEHAVAESERRAGAQRVWSEWASRLDLPHEHGPAVLRSALTIKALCHGPTGAIAAAATTSLPEEIGGVRNWDYRYCWHRDAAMAALALVRLGSFSEALRFLDWILHVVERSEAPERMAPLYTVSGDPLGSEAEISELRGYRASRPVRIGNAASAQVQLDVFGPVVELVAELLRRGASLSGEHWRVVQTMARAVETRWREPDHGIWEIRAARRHHTHSKVMCWLTADRAAWVSESLRGRPGDSMRALAEEIKADILANAWSERLNAFSGSYGADDPDAGALWVGLSGMLSADDPRFLATIDAVERDLREGPVVYRYDAPDGLPGREGGFNLCTTWLIEALAMAGQPDRARRLLEEYLKLQGPTGLLSEEFDPGEAVALGNHPQAYSHLGLIEAALALQGR
jgi:trehalose 6-phosphate phosphatase